MSALPVPPAVAEWTVLEYARVMQAIGALHRRVPDGSGDYCAQDGKPWPCRTVVATTPGTTP